MTIIPSWAIGVGFILTVFAVAQIVVVKLRASVRIPPPADPGVGELRQELEAMQGRLGDLEERLDFTERLLANQRDAGRLEPPAP